MTLTPEQVYKLGGEYLGWNSSTAEGKELIAEDMALLNQRHLANMPLSNAD